MARYGLLLLVAPVLAEAFMPSGFVQLRGSQRFSAVSHVKSLGGSRALCHAMGQKTISTSRVHSTRRTIVAQAASGGGEMTQEQLIEKLLATPPYELPNIVGQNLRAISSPNFFMGIAALSDASNDDARKEQLSVLADNIVATLEAVMARTEERMDGAAELVQSLIASAAEANGEFIVPLQSERVKLMRKKVASARTSIDEGILSTIFAYMKKANEDNLEGMVVIFQKILQLWAAEELVVAGANNKVLERLLLVEAEEWDTMLKAAIKANETDAEAMQAAVQSCVERVVLQQASGSYGQRVQAEFLRELMSRVKAATAEK